MNKDKVRVYQLARELGVESKDLIDLLKSAGADVKNHMTTIDPEMHELAKQLVGGNKGAGDPRPPRPGPRTEARVGPIPAPQKARPVALNKSKTPPPRLVEGQVGAANNQATLSADANSQEFGLDEDANREFTNTLQDSSDFATEEDADSADLAQSELDAAEWVAEEDHRLNDVLPKEIPLDEASAVAVMDAPEIEPSKEEFDNSRQDATATAMLDAPDLDRVDLASNANGDDDELDRAEFNPNTMERADSDSVESELVDSELLDANLADPESAESTPAESARAELQRERGELASPSDAAKAPASAPPVEKATPAPLAPSSPLAPSAPSSRSGVLPPVPSPKDEPVTPTAPPPTPAISASAHSERAPKAEPVGTATPTSTPERAPEKRGDDRVIEARSTKETRPHDKITERTPGTSEKDRMPEKERSSEKERATDKPLEKAPERAPIRNPADEKRAPVQLNAKRPITPIPSPGSNRPQNLSAPQAKPLPTKDKPPARDPQQTGSPPPASAQPQRSGRRPIVVAPPAGAKLPSEAPKKKKNEPQAQKPVMKLPEALQAAKHALPEPVKQLLPEQPKTPKPPVAHGTPPVVVETEEEKLRKRNKLLQKEREERKRSRARVATDGEEDGDMAPARGHRPKQPRRPVVPVPQQRGPVVLDSPLGVRAFCEAAGISAKEVMRKLMTMNILLTINSALTEEQAQLLGLEFGLDVQIRKQLDAASRLDEKMEAFKDDPKDLAPRSPIVTFMGHVDHGKTSLMDRIRQTNVVASESGGITQHIGAYQVKLPGGRAITFLDTPGHEAFTSMRARGANVTDIVVLVVAADDGVMPQTEEAINHAKAADVPIVVAMNKIDLPTINVERLQQQLAGHSLISEAWGGDTLMVGTSATTGKGIEDLLESLNLVADLRELKANPNRAATGTCIEASLNQESGAQCTLLVQNGTLRRGDVVVCGSAFGRVRAMYDEHGRLLEEAPPSTPVVVVGWDEVPHAGEQFVVIDDVSKAREVAMDRKSRMRAESQAMGRPKPALEDFFQKKLQELVLIVKADVRGSLEAIRKELGSFDHKEVKVRLIHDGIGAVTDRDVLLADASNAIILGFRVAPDDSAQSLATEKGVELRRYDIIYQLTDDIRKALEGLLIPEKREVQSGKAVVQETFTISRIGTIAGCRVISGTIDRNAKLRVIRDGTVLGTYGIETLRRFKDDVREVRDGLECGIKLTNFNDVKRGDVFEAFKIEEIKRTL